ncbi:hypothetical protein MtrunA17_Chr4g0075551 [Medicago truncatula]|uniref:Uncharacterized protein n=1 Tax=Medicago truncatula TaxID=3880 RepID=A0A396IJJ1_MEDTR|nr:hypothetical protein MtrunA17_Chr4g0075551 [Medicago truncatula]
MKITRLRSFSVSKKKKIPLIWRQPRKIMMMKRKKKDKDKNTKRRKILVDVQSYNEFKTLFAQILFEEYVTQGGATSVVSFNISHDVDSQSYSQILEDIIASNSKLGRRDKIEDPRTDHWPRQIVLCYTLEEMKKVYNAIGSDWRAIMAVSWKYPSAMTDKILDRMDDFQQRVGILDHHRDPYWH